MKNIETVSDVIRETLCVFQGGRNWVKDSFGPTNKDVETSSYCLLGGVRAVLGDGNQNVGEKHRLYQDTVTFLAKTISPKGKIDTETTIVRFNDSTRTSFDRVEAILAAALVKARKLAGVGA